MFAAYVIVAGGTIGRGVLLSPAHACVCGAGSPDPSQYMWALAWWPHALLHGTNPLFTHSIWFPEGANIAAAAMIPAAALAMWPVTAAFGPLVSYNVLAILSPALSALTAYLLCRRLTGHREASLVGGFVFGFSSYELSQLLGHANLSLVFLLPVMAHLALRRFDGDLSRRRFVVAMTAVLVAQALLSTEILLDAALVGGIALIVAYATVSRSNRQRVDVLVLDTLIAAAVSVLVLLPYVIAALAQTPTARAVYALDALNLVIPTPVTWLGGNLFHSVSATFEGGAYSETDGYFGAPLLLAATILSLTRWRTQRAVRFLAILLFATIILACGATLRISGHALIPLPWRLLEHLPLLPGIAPSRIAVFAALILAAMVAIWLAGPRRHRTWRWLIAALGVAALFPNLAGAYWNSQLDNPAFFRTGEYRHYLAPGEDLLTIPFASTGNSMLWQAETGFSFRMPGGYISSTRPKAALHSAAITQFYGGSSPAARIPTRYVSAIATFLHNHRVDHIAIEPRFRATWRAVLARIAKRPRRIGGILLYTVDAPPAQKR